MSTTQNTHDSQDSHDSQDTHDGHPARSAAGGSRPRSRRVVVTGVLAVPAAATVTTLAAALAGAVGVDLTIPDGGEQVPLAGIAFVTGVFSTTGVLLALVLARWSAEPRKRFVVTTASLTAVSLVPPLLVGAHPAAAATLVGLHLLAAAVMVPALARSLRARAR